MPGPAPYGRDTVWAMTDPLGRVAVTPKTGAERFRYKGSERTEDLLGFWRWTSSDLVGNAMRGLLAEFIVGMAVDSIASKTREEWDAADLVTSDGTRIEVKSAAYLQSWAQKGLSKISFGIQPTVGWDASTGTYGTERKRQAHVYVFCVLHHVDKSSVDPMNLEQWTFYVLSTTRLNEKLPTQKRVALSSLLKLEPEQTDFLELGGAIARAALEAKLG